MNLQVVADRAGVSVATVSRVVNNRPGVSKGKVDRIKKAIKELGFIPKTRVTRSIPSVAPKGLKYGNVAVLVLGRGHMAAAELFVRQLDPICYGLAQHGITPVVCMGAGSLEEMPPVLQKKLVDGILLFGDVTGSSLELIDQIERHFDGIPMFWMTSHHEGAGTFVLAGNREIGRTGAGYCREKRCLRVLAVCSDMGSEVHKARYQSFLNCAKEYSMKTDLLLGGQSADIQSSLHDALMRNAERVKRADGLFFPSDRLTAYAYPALRRSGVFDVNKALVVVSCGGAKSYLCGLEPRPVSIDMGADLIGQQAVEQILWRIRHPGEKRQLSVVIHPELIE